ncbi:MAG: deoxyribodipyrimidine photo-lyase [Flavobacteriales bacterium]|jgi:deoxyribodipyrimidine photo-lyase|tara:strand:- start:4458 stop:5576 length:1119 start_codon:yes stop_codon:yes gene_type:complete
MELFEQESISFPTSYEDILKRIKSIDPIKYGSSRNYINGAVSYLSPYISRGVISTKLVFEEILQRGHPTGRVQKIIQELAWRDYWQQVWIAKGDAIDNDLKHQQSPINNSAIPEAIFHGKTGIKAIDSAIAEFYETGYLHNHVRMYIASIACNIGKSHWKVPAQWMYYHLLDADWASNALSWQWVAGANANKKYIANQENINKYCFTNQKNTFLDVEYEDILQLKMPEVLKNTPPIELTTPLPSSENINIDNSLPTLIYNFYNLDPLWKKEDKVNRILLLEPSHFKKFPVSSKTIQFTLQLAKENINGIQIFVGEFDKLVSAHEIKEIHYKEHPTNIHYKGIEEPRDWMFSIKGYYNSFFSFWKKCQKELVY